MRRLMVWILCIAMLSFFVGGGGNYLTEPHPRTRGAVAEHLARALGATDWHRLSRRRGKLKIGDYELALFLMLIYEYDPELRVLNPAAGLDALFEQLDGARAEPLGRDGPETALALLETLPPAPVLVSRGHWSLSAIRHLARAGLLPRLAD